MNGSDLRGSSDNCDNLSHGLIKGFEDHYGGGFMPPPSSRDVLRDRTSEPHLCFNRDRSFLLACSPEKPFDNPRSGRGDTDGIVIREALQLLMADEDVKLTWEDVFNSLKYLRVKTVPGDFYWGLYTPIEPSNYLPSAYRNPCLLLQRIWEYKYNGNPAFREVFFGPEGAAPCCDPMLNPGSWPETDALNTCDGWSAELCCGHAYNVGVDECCQELNRDYYDPATEECKCNTDACCVNANSFMTTYIEEDEECGCVGTSVEKQCCAVNENFGAGREIAAVTDGVCACLGDPTGATHTGLISCCNELSPESFQSGTCVCVPNENMDASCQCISDECCEIRGFSRYEQGGCVQ